MLNNVIPVRVPKMDQYDIVICNNVMSQIGLEILEEYGPVSVVVITDTNVSKLYGEEIRTSFTKAGIPVDMIVLPSGERTKSLSTAKKLYKQLLELGTRRRSILVSFGGGVIMDTIGFVAATYMRGIPYINVPTSLLAQVDSAIGGKVAVNHPQGKNLVGAFYHPNKVYSDPTVLKTLSLRDIRCGMAEVIKTAIIADEDLFEFVENNVTDILKKDIKVLEEIVLKTSALKVKLLKPDPYEKNLKRPLNFGHTIGHAVEKEEAYRRIRHGEAVAVGMAVATQIAIKKGICSLNAGNRIIDLLKRMGLPTFSRVPSERIWQAISIIKMIRDGNLYFVLPSETLGEVVITNDVTEAEIIDAVNLLKS